MTRVLSPADVRMILGQMVNALSALESRGSIYVIGGAAIALENPDRIGTSDIDGYVRDVDATDVIEQLQREWGLEANWFNWDAQGLQPPVGGPEMWHEVMREGAVTLFAANLDALLAMKFFAARHKDMADIAYLMEACGVTSVDEAEEVYDRHYPGEGLSDKAITRITFLLDHDPPKPQQ